MIGLASGARQFRLIFDRFHFPDLKVLNLKAVVVFSPFTTVHHGLGDFFDRKIREIIKVLHTERAAHDKQAPGLAYLVREPLELLTGERLCGHMEPHGLSPWYLHKNTLLRP